jgi:hypothetical protein
MILTTNYKVVRIKILFIILLLYPVYAFSSVIGFIYYIDETGVYYGYEGGRGRKIEKKNLQLLEGADPNTFISFNNIFGKDKKKAYYLNRKMAGVNVKTFEYLGNSFAKDKKHVYYCDKLLKNISIDGVEHIPDLRNAMNDYIKNKNHVYYIDTKMSDSPDSFKILDYYYCKDDKHLYFFDGKTNKIVEGADPENYTQEKYYIISNRKVFLFGEETQFDAASFKIVSNVISIISDSYEWGHLSHSFTYDKNGYYINGIPVAPPSTDIDSYSSEFNASRIKMYKYTTPYPRKPKTTKGIKLIE